MAVEPNRNSSSSSPSPGAPGGPRFYVQPRTVANYLHNFKVSLEDFFSTENPGRPEDYYLMGDYVVPTSQRKIIIYVAHAPLATARKISRIYYVLPVEPRYAHIYEDHPRPDETLASQGPLLHTFDVPADKTATEFVDAILADSAAGPPSGHLTLWGPEIARVRTVGETPGIHFGRRRAANQITQFWTPLRTRILEILREVGIKGPTNAGRLPSPWRSPVVAITPAGSPAAPVRSSSASRRRRSSERRRRATRRRTTSDPTNLRPKNIYNTDPVTGKRLRRRRAESDPRNDAI